MLISHAAAPGDHGANHDRFRTGHDWALILDGAGRYPGHTGGCVHSVTWVVDRLAHYTGQMLAARRDRALPDVAREAIAATAADHGPACDLSDPLSPGASLAMVRTAGDATAWLVLGDVAVAFDLDDDGGHPLVVVDDRVDRLPGPVTDSGPVRTYSPDYVATVRNRPGGFWVAGAVPEAADHALTGEVHGARRVLLCSDGVTRLVERHGWTWRRMVDEASRPGGPGSLVRAVRAADAADPNPSRWRGKRHDDATVALAQLVRQAAEDGPRRPDRSRGTAGLIGAPP
jgi:hypothetical protein